MASQIRKAIALQLGILCLVLALNAVSTRERSLEMVQAHAPTLQKLFFENERQQLSERLFILSESLGAGITSWTRRGDVLVSIAGPTLAVPHLKAFRLSPSASPDGWFQVDLPLFSFNFTSFAVWVIAAALLQLFLTVYDRNSANQTKQLLEISRLNGIASSVNLIAHDIRKPFSIFKVLLDGIKSAKSEQELRTFTETAIPEIQSSMDSVEGLLQDVMQVGADAPELTLEEVTPESLLNSVLSETFRGHPEAEVIIQTSIDQPLLLMVDYSKSKRIFANIITNACQAIGWKGRIWIHATKNADRIHFKLGNSGSFIPEENIPKLFDAFFTSNKRGGTGLGLAIAKKWTEAHGGQISCHSERSKDYPNGMVEFTFDLPAGSATSDLERPKVHNHSSAYRLILNFDMASEIGGSVEEASRQIKERLSNLKIPLHVVALDDEAVFLDGLRTAIESLRLGEPVSFSAYPKEPAEGLDKADLHLVDFDLGLYDRNGLDVIRELRASQPHAFVCLHTNRTDAQTFRSAVEAGADAVYTKPMTPEHMAKLLIEALNRRESTPAADAPSKPLQTSEPVKLKVAFADDSLVMRLSWKRALAADVDLKVFSSPEEIMSTQETFDVVVTDMNFDNSDLSGKDVANWVRTSLPKARVLLCSNEGNVSDLDLFDGRVPKSETPTHDALFPVD